MSKAGIPAQYEGHRVVTAAEMAELDQKTISELGIPALVLMENAGKAVAEETERFLREKGRDLGQSMIVVCCGRGNNGGDGLVAARYLRQTGSQVVAYLAPPRRGAGYPPLVAENVQRASAAGVSLQEVGAETVDLDVRLRSCDVILDALLGTGSAGKPSGTVHDVIQRMMKAGKPIIAVDIPSGIHPDSGYHSGVYVTATMTVTLGLPKRGLLAPHSRRNVGILKIADIGYPKDLLAKTA